MNSLNRLQNGDQEFDLALQDELKNSLQPLNTVDTLAVRKALMSQAALVKSRRARREPWRRAYNVFRRSLGLVPQQDVTLTYFTRTLTHTFDFNLRMIHVVG
jgi:hypothetical protein